MFNPGKMMADQQWQREQNDLRTRTEECLAFLYKHLSKESYTVVLQEMKNSPTLKSFVQ